MLRSGSCWFEFYSVITERETDRDRETGGREERQGKRKWGKEKEKGERGKETGREETHIHTHKGNALQRKCLTYTKYNLRVKRYGKGLCRWVDIYSSAGPKKMVSFTMLKSSKTFC